MILYNMAQVLIKLSFLTLYRRIFTSGRTKTVCLWLIALLGVWGVAQVAVLTLSCQPLALLSSRWNDFCLDGVAVWYLTSITNIVADFVVFLLPIPAIRKLQLRRRQKFLIASLFGLGLL